MGPSSLNYNAHIEQDHVEWVGIYYAFGSAESWDVEYPIGPDSGAQNTFQEEIGQILELGTQRP